ncbi:MAG TPA: hypothetical protein VFG21_04745 [Xanthomonadaceae bacterium]|nr:hypothetical protein [Xanthomonadaceae bacterium]
MGPVRLAVLALLLPAATAVTAQAVFEDHTVVAFDSPEAWAMNYVGAATLMSAFGQTPDLAPGRWAASVELGHIPRLDEKQQQVGFSGTKAEDLNKSPVFGRARGWLGLPGGFVAELGWTPPLTIDGLQPQDLFAAALSRRLVDRPAWSLSLRLHGQHGSAHGDITCPRELAGVQDLQVNPFGCGAPSDDRIELNHYGADATLGFGAPASPWRGHFGLGRTRVEPRVQVDALSFGTIDRSRLIAGGWLTHAAVGVRRDLDAHWSLAGEVLYVPLEVVRDPTAGERDNDAFWSLRLMLRYVR